jgi:putative flippase GtrA
MTKKTFISPTTNSFLQLFRTAFVGFITFAVDALLLYIITELGVYYLISTAMSFVVSFFLNFYLVREFVFQKRNMSIKAELLGYAGIAAVCLVLTEFCMYFLTEYVGVYYLISKFLAAVVVLLWSFTARKFWLYK